MATFLSQVNVNAVVPEGSIHLHSGLVIDNFQCGPNLFAEVTALLSPFIKR